MTINTERLKTDAAYWDEVAPEWASHFDTVIDAFCNWKGYEAPKDGKYHGWGTNRSSHLEEFADQFIHRPTKPSAPEWDGEGLPPVGCECEYTARKYCSAHPSITPDHWYGCKIIAYHDGAVWTSDNGIRRLSNTRFRPLRTAEQRQREDLIEILQGNWLNSDMDQLADAILSKYTLEPKK